MSTHFGMANHFGMSVTLPPLPTSWAAQAQTGHGLKRSKGKESRWATQMNHQVSREIIDIVATQGGVLHVEKLLGIRDRVKMTRKVNRMVHSWPFAQLLDFLTYKAALAGVQVIEEDPRHTSQRCNRSCGHTERKNRQAQAVFRCVAPVAIQLHV